MGLDAGLRGLELGPEPAALARGLAQGRHVARREVHVAGLALRGAATGGGGGGRGGRREEGRLVCQENRMKPTGGGPCDSPPSASTACMHFVLLLLCACWWFGSRTRHCHWQAFSQRASSSWGDDEPALCVCACAIDGHSMLAHLAPGRRRAGAVWRAGLGPWRAPRRGGGGQRGSAARAQTVAHAEHGGRKGRGRGAVAAAGAGIAAASAAALALTRAATAAEGRGPRRVEVARGLEDEGGAEAVLGGGQRRLQVRVGRGQVVACPLRREREKPAARAGEGEHHDDDEEEKMGARGGEKRGLRKES